MEALEHGEVLNRITVPESIAVPARIALERMLSLEPGASVRRQAMKHIHRRRLRHRRPHRGHRAQRRQHAVTLVTKAALAESNTRWAQGGIAAAMFSDDSVADHIADTLAAGAGLCNPAAVEVLCTEGPDRIRDLIRLGVAFDHATTASSPRGLEAAHSYPRVLHAGGDATGLTIEIALVRAVRSNPTSPSSNTPSPRT